MLRQILNRIGNDAKLRNDILCFVGFAVGYALVHLLCLLRIASSAVLVRPAGAGSVRAGQESRHEEDHPQIDGQRLRSRRPPLRICKTVKQCYITGTKKRYADLLRLPRRMEVVRIFRSMGNIDPICQKSRCFYENRRHHADQIEQ